MKKIWPYLTTLLAGFILGMIFYIKALDDPDYQYQVTIKKLKSKRNQGQNSGIIPVIKIEQDDTVTEEIKPGFRLKNLFKSGRKNRKTTRN
jgi:hypothetical protein